MNEDVKSDLWHQYKGAVQVPHSYNLRAWEADTERNPREFDSQSGTWYQKVQKDN